MNKEKLAKNSNHNNTNLGMTITRRNNEDWSHIAKLLKESKCESVEEFYLNLDIPERTYYDQLKVNQELKDAHDYKMRKLGIENEKYAKKNKMSMNSVVGEMLLHYLPRYQSSVEWKTKLKAIAESENSNVPKAVIDYILAEKK